MFNDLTKELSANFIEYAAAVNSDRAIPDAKSGLKPVARRILYSAYDNGMTSNKAHVKNARIVGNVMGALHPHGDSSIYGALVRLAQDWVMRYPLLDFHGNMGNICGDGPAASRYTESRLSKLTEEGMLNNLKKKVVNFIPNYDESEEEPETLPAIFPNLLCNPNTGIGVALACHWAPHNLKEVAQAIYDYMDGNEPALPGPDFPTGGVIINKKDLPTIVKSGRGSVKVRGRYEIKGNTIIFTEIPYETTIEGILTDISDACEAQEITGITDVRDESGKKGLRIVITCEKDANINSILNKLFSKTSLQSSFSYNQVALIDKTPVELTLKDCIKVYIDHNVECLIKEFNYDLTKAQNRLEIVNGLLKALEDIDNIIALIKKSSSSSVAKDQLISSYKFTENQAKAIIDMKLGRLAGLERIEIQNEQAELTAQIEELTSILNAPEKQIQVIRTRLENLVKKFGDARRTEITQIDIKPEEKEIAEVVPEECFVTISETGLIKRIPVQNYKTQRRGGVGVKNNDDITAFVCKTNTIDTLMIFSSAGKMYRLVVDNIPEGTNSSKGISLGNLISFETGEKPMAYASLHHGTTAKYVFFVTEKGLVKKVPLEEYSKTKKTTGIIALNLNEGDRLAAVTFIEEEDIVLVTKLGMAIRFSSKELTISSRIAKGMKGIGLKDEDTVLTCLPIKHNTDNLAIVSKDGSCRQNPVSEYPCQGRGGKGLMCYKGEIAGAALVDSTDELLVVGDRTSIRVAATEIPTLSRVSLGNSIIKNNNKVVSISKI